MSSSTTGPDRSSKRRNACDTCKRRKVRCIGSTSNNGSCDTCITARLDCTYTGTFKNRVISKDYIERLESRLFEVELLLKKAQNSGPSSSDSREITSMTLTTHQTFNNLTANSMPENEEELELSDEDFDRDNMLQQGISSINISPRFHGRSSSSKFVSTVFEKNRETIEQSSTYSDKASNSVLEKRPQFWSPFPWESESNYFLNILSFPEKDLLDSLVTMYFEHIDYMYGLLHQPTFEALVAEGLHHHDSQFANVLLLVVANASRFSKDTRVVLEGTGSWLSCGWQWFSPVDIYNKATLAVPSLFNVQAIALYTIFIQNCPSQEEGWSLASAGLRLAQAIGAHRKKVYASKITVIDELWKRAFWCLYILDRQFCLAFGRPCSLHDEDFDLDLPIDCDPEYWVQSNPEDCFKQPPNKPSKVAFLVTFIEASFILSFALRTVYSINKSKAFMRYTGQGWEERLVAELDSRINSWEAKIPDHLRFSAHIQDPTFFAQATILACVYHDLRILVHYPFVAPGGKPSSITFSCLVSCENAARACSTISTVYSQRTPMFLAPVLLHTAFTAAIILFFKLFSARKAGTVVDIPGTMAGIHGCMRVLENAESRCWAAGQHRDVLYNLALLGGIPLPSTLSSTSAVLSEASNLRPTTSPDSFAAPEVDGSVFADPTQSLNDTHASILQGQQSQATSSTFVTDEQIRNMWNNAPTGLGLDMDWASYLNTLNWMSADNTANQ